MKKTIERVFEVFGVSAVFALFVITVLSVYSFGYKTGYGQSQKEAYEILDLQKKSAATMQKGETKIIYVTPAPVQAKTTPKWGGPDLWNAVNNKRLEYGVNALSSKGEICTIASIRLNQLLDLGGLDGHEGFSKLPDERPDLKWIFDEYNLSEFLVSGATSPADAVSLWENTLGHKKLLTGGEYVWGCIYAQNGFGVAIAAY